MHNERRLVMILNVKDRLEECSTIELNIKVQPLVIGSQCKYDDVVQNWTTHTRWKTVADAFILPHFEHVKCLKANIPCRDHAVSPPNSKYSRKLIHVVIVQVHWNQETQNECFVLSFCMICYTCDCISAALTGSLPTFGCDRKEILNNESKCVFFFTMYQHFIQLSLILAI